MNIHKRWLNDRNAWNRACGRQLLTKCANAFFSFAFQFWKKTFYEYQRAVHWIYREASWCVSWSIVDGSFRLMIFVWIDISNCMRHHSFRYIRKVPIRNFRLVVYSGFQNDIKYSSNNYAILLERVSSTGGADVYRIFERYVLCIFLIDAK